MSNSSVEFQRHLDDSLWNDSPLPIDVEAFDSMIKLRLARQRQTHNTVDLSLDDSDEEHGQEKEGDDNTEPIDPLTLSSATIIFWNG